MCHCDNQVVVASICSRSSRNPGLMHLIRCLVFIEARHNCFIHATYIDTRANHLADDLSRNRASHFLSKVPTANAQPSPHYCTCCWIPRRTGYRGHGASGSAIFRGRTSTGDSQVVHGRHEEISAFLHPLQY